MSVLSGQFIWLIGASHGIGEALATALVDKDAVVAISARSTDKLEKMAEKLGSNCHAYPCDCAQTDTIQAAYEALKAAHGVPDMIVYAAGLYDPMSSASFDLDAVTTMMDVNVVGAVRTLHVTLPNLLSRNAGTIALFGSVAGYRGLPKAMGYGMSKAALIHLAENLRQDLHDTALRVTIINPGFVATRLTDKNDFDMPARITPESAAQAIVRGLEKEEYEIHFPKRFTYVMKLLQLLPSRLYFWLSAKLL